LPGLSVAKAEGHRARCASNLRQIILANSMYVADEGNFPLSIFESSTAIIWWPEELERYANARWENALYHCPAFPWTNEPPPRISGVGNNGYGSYDMNADGVFEIGPSSVASLGIGGKRYAVQKEYRPRKEAEVVAPAEMMGFGDTIVSRRIS